MTQKGLNLKRLSDHGVRVPAGFTLGPHHYRAAVEPFVDEIEKMVNAQEEVAEFFAELILDPSTVEEITDGLSKINAVEGDRFAVRSSGSVVSDGTSVEEDSSASALAGQFESFLHVPMDYVQNAVLQCWASLFNPRSIATFQTGTGYVRQSEMAVVIQEMIPASVSMVMMTVDPLGDGSTGGMELSIGPCEAIVAGLVSPDEIIFDRNTGLATTTSIGAKEVFVEYEPYSPGTTQDHINMRTVPSPPGTGDSLAVEPSTVDTLIRIGHEIESIFGEPQDIEAVITAAGEIVITQARPVTCTPTKISEFHVSQTTKGDAS